jgi:hypothetical protein
MGVTATTVEIARGVAMPFVPMKASVGEPLRTKVQIKSAVAELENENVIIQPVPGGVRACLALVDKKVFIQDQNGNWITAPPANGHDFLKLPNNTCLDGYIAGNIFYAADCLAVRGSSLIFRAAAEREAVAYQLTKLLHHQWLFRRPSSKFIQAAKQNLPNFQGLTLKDYMSFYVLASKNPQLGKEWRSRQW